MLEYIVEQGSYMSKNHKRDFILIGLAWAITLVLADHWWHSWTGTRLWKTFWY